MTTLKMTEEEVDTIDLNEIDISDALLKKLVVFNDDVNTFEHVIETFVEILKHSEEQAYQCALIIHTVGKCEVKEGTLQQLNPFKQAICERGIDARIL